MTTMLTRVLTLMAETDVAQIYPSNPYAGHRRAVKKDERKRRNKAKATAKASKKRNRK